MNREEMQHYFHLKGMEIRKNKKPVKVNINEKSYRVEEGPPYVC
jgi:hypothetical protein